MTNDRLRSDKVDQLTSRNVDLHGRRFLNAGKSQGPSDFVTQQEIPNLTDSTPVKNSFLHKIYQIFSNTIQLLNLAPNRPLKLDLKGEVISKQIDLTDLDDVSGILPIANGGTNNDTQSTGGVAYFDGTKIVTSGLLYYDAAQGIFSVGTLTPIGSLTPEGLFQVHCATDQNFIITGKVSLSTGVCIRTPNDAATLQQGLEFRNDPLLFGISTATIGFFGGTPVVKQTLNAYIPDDESAAFGGIATGLGGTIYAQVANLNQLRVAYETLRAMVDDLRTKIQTTTLVG